MILGVGPKLGGKDHDGVYTLGINTPGSSAPLILSQSHMVGVISQNSVNLIGLLMILPSESDLNYQCVICFVMYSWALDEIFH